MCLDGHSFQEMSSKCCCCTASKVRTERGSTGPASYSTVILYVPCDSLFLDHSQCPRQEFTSPPKTLFSAENIKVQAEVSRVVVPLKFLHDSVPDWT